MWILKKFKNRNFSVRTIKVPLIADILPLNNSEFGDFVYLIELEIKYVTDTGRPASYIDLHSEDELRTKLYDKRDDLDIPIVTFPFISVSENFLAEAERFYFLQNKISPFLAQGICIYVGHSFL
jgi:hypothetical protein